MRSKDRGKSESWTEAQKRQVVAAYRQHGYAICPGDGVVLRSMHVSTQEARYEVFLRCPRCGQLCFSGDVDVKEV